MPDPNDPTQGPSEPPMTPEEADAVREASEASEPVALTDRELATEEEGQIPKSSTKSSIQLAMEKALKESLAISAAHGSLELKTYPISEKMRARLSSEFTYHAPREDQIPRYNALRSMALTFAVMVVELTPPSREQSLALTKLGEVIMHANAAIARGEGEGGGNVPSSAEADADFAELLRSKR